jgi:uncharacterized protein (TIGR04255 family)
MRNKLVSKYKRNYLTSVVVRVDFVSPLEGADTQFPKELAEIIMVKFPIPESTDVVLQDVKITSEGMAIGQSKWKRWDFFSRDKTKFARLERQCFLVQYKSYESFDVLKDDFLPLLKSLEETFPEATISRLGLRYIDTIEIDEPSPLDWDKWIDPKLLGVLAVPRGCDIQLIARAFQRLEFNYDDMSLNFQYGMYNPDYPAPIRRKQFTLDTDAFCTGLLKKEEIPERLEEFHSRIKELFEDCITEALRDKMNE